MISKITKSALIISALAMGLSSCSESEKADETTISDSATAVDETAAVAAAVEHMKESFINATVENLTELSVPELRYGHSDGRIETQAEFIEAIAGGVNDYLTYENSNQEILVNGNTACVRHVMDAKIIDHEKEVNPHLMVLTVWTKTDDGWKLMARQATKFPA